MHVPLIDRSIRWKLLIAMGGIIFAFFLVSLSANLRTHSQLEREIGVIAAKLAAITPGDHPDIQAELDAMRLSAADSLRVFCRAELTVLVVLLVAGIGILLIATRHITAPIRRLTEGAREIARGNFFAATALQTNTHDELGKLSRAFVQMAEATEATQADLSQKIAELSRAEERWHLFYNQSRDLLGIASLDSIILNPNEGFLNTLGYPREEIVGTSYLKLVHPDDLERTIIVVKQMSEGRDAVEFENRFRCRDGSYRRIVWNATVHPDLSCIYAVGRDVTEQRRLEEEVIRAAAEERERIARDIHDSLGQTMTGLAFKAKLIEQILRDQAIPEVSQAAEIVALANQASRQAQSLARGLDPVELQHGLIAALEYLAHSTRDLFGVRISLEYEPEAARIEKVIANHLYRIAQESVTNAIRHSKPTHISIYLTRSGNMITLIVMDDGSGIKTDAPPSDGLGLHIMKYRARMIGGVLDILPGPLGGLLIKCSAEIKNGAG